MEGARYVHGAMRERGMSGTTELVGDQAARRRRLCSGGPARVWRNREEERTSGRGVR